MLLYHDNAENDNDDDDKEANMKGTWIENEPFVIMPHTQLIRGDVHSDADSLL